MILAVGSYCINSAKVYSTENLKAVAFSLIPNQTTTGSASTFSTIIRTTQSISRTVSDRRTRQTTPIKRIKRHKITIRKAEVDSEHSANIGTGAGVATAPTTRDDKIATLADGRDCRGLLLDILKRRGIEQRDAINSYISE